MAEAAAAALVKVIFEKLADEAFKRYARSQNIHSELKQLGSTLSQIQALLNDASHKEITDESVRLWLNSLQHLAYDIDDVLDEVATEAMHRELTPESEASTSMVRKLIPTCCTKFSLSHRLSPKLDRITTKLQHLEKQNPGLIVKGEKPKINSNRRNETSLPERDVVGREVETKKLLNQLLVGESSKENFSILPIVGLGGVGKTTLARILYNDTLVKDHFELMAWVCVSDECDVFKISETIFECVATENKQFKDVNQLQIALREQFKDKRFLLVLDDVWNQNYDDWEILVRPFHSGAAGSRVIMTTRQQDLLKKIGFNHVDNLESLSHEDALSLLALHALDVDNFDSHETLKPQADGIVKKCGGLPLALKAIGRLLRTKTQGEEWDDVLKSKIWDLENADAIVPALRLSYHDLSADLKRLFAYCSLFPKDFMFDKEELILLWIADGYLNESTADKSPERLGHEYFEKLLSRSFFQPAPNGESFFVMHDLMNDLAAFVAGEYFLRFENQTEMAMEALAKYRHMSFMRERYVGFQKFEAFQRARSLRTLLAVYVGVEQSWNTFYISNKILVDLLPQLPLLRVLSLRRFNISEVPDAICSLNHLRYLNLSETRISKLPENVGNLYNLQTLIVFGCNCLTTLPKSFLKLKKLRHFDIGETPCLKKLPLGIGELKNLQTLPKVIIGGDGDFAITKLKGLENLHGELSIEGLHKVQIPMHAREANLSQKRLTKLKLKWGDGSQRGTLEKEVLTDGSQRGTHEKEVLTELKPHTDTLKHFGVEYYGGVEFPGWVVDPSFRELVHVSIRGCKKCTSLPPFGQLPSLKELLIQGMDEVKVIGTELLRIKNCPKLIDVSLEALPSLRVLRIEGCGESVLRSLIQAGSSTTKLKIRSILGLTDEVWRGVIEYLGAVEELSIQHCNEIRYLWKSNTEASKVLVNLKELKVFGCKKLVSLGEKEDEDNTGSDLLSSLKKLDIKFCESMERLCCPNSIESLGIFGCSSVRDVSFPRATTGEVGQNLKSVTIDINGCGNLKSINQLSSTHLTSLSIISCQNMELFSDLRQLSNLTRLTIDGCKSMESFPDLQLSNLTMLKYMDISSCPMIDASFPRGLWPPNLGSLKIGGLKKPISEWGNQNFPASLVRLILCSEPDVRNFSQLSHLFPSSLTSLAIIEFDKLESLSTGLQHLTSLQHLTINTCPKLNDLPETLLLSLLSLSIYGDCPKLKERCGGRGSHYWPLISHIPCIFI
ncbi:putative P-loop containing nucleoside triphosphate hydrolase, leucine-rich repeat domain superfamily [Helianthus annuus]|nr:putative P-loop containing nucleoside triphosphate hydrolase, leucine-rich repeat domain superfamily [Helianthus annuus]